MLAMAEILQRPCHRICLSAMRLKTEMLTEKWHYIILKAVSHLTGVGALVHLETIHDSIFFEHIVEFDRINT